MRLAWVGWAVVGVEALLLNLLTPKAFAALIGAALATSGCAAFKQHVKRMEQITAEHAEKMSKQVLAIEKFFDIAIRSDRIARIDAAEGRSTNGFETGPFHVYKGA